MIFNIDASRSLESITRSVDAHVKHLPTRQQIVSEILQGPGDRIPHADDETLVAIVCFDETGWTIEFEFEVF